MSKKHPRRLVELAGASNLGLFLGLCGGLFYRQSEMRGPLTQQRGLAEARRGGDQRQLARYTLIPRLLAHPPARQSAHVR